jgi:hypothetical protein
VAIINKVVSWAKNTQENNPRIFWLHGMAGEGKSSIATSVACRLDDENTLGAFFFFSRDRHDRSLPNKVFSSIAFLLSHHHPLIGKAVYEEMKSEVIEKKLPVDDLPVKSQFQHFILQPILKFREKFDPTRPIVIVLDAPDECEDREDLLESLAEFMELPSTFRLLLSSRTEKDIKTTIDRMGGLVQQHDLSNEVSKIAVKVDVSAFIARRMKEIRSRWDSLDYWSDWPGSEKQGALVDRAYGLFIWASTAMQFVDEEDPNGQLDVLLEGSSALPVSASSMTGLDSLYKTVLRRAYTETPQIRRFELFRRVVGAILTIANPVPLSTLGVLLDIDCEPARACGIVQDVISRLRSVVYLPDQQKEGSQPIRIIHPSFADFLTNKKRSGNFFIDPLKRHVEIAIRFLKLVMVQGRDNAVAHAAISYATGTLGHHFHQIFKTPPGSKFIDPLRQTLRDLRDLLQRLHDSRPGLPWHFDPDTSQKDWRRLISDLEVSPFVLYSIFSDGMIVHLLSSNRTIVQTISFQYFEIFGAFRVYVILSHHCKTYAHRYSRLQLLIHHYSSVVHTRWISHLYLFPNRIPS